MNPLLLTLVHSLWITGSAMLILGGLLSVLRPLGTVGQHLSKTFARAPLLDVWVAALTWLPWLIAGLLGGWIAVLGAIIGQSIALVVWCFLHELAHPRARRGPRIIKFINRTIGRWRNILALWVTLVALPGFWIIRIVQIFAYWPLVVLLKFPNYRHGDWINVSRHKFEGLVGHDLIWCLYCDWMTGVYSLGAEMLRNVESFWCPIRFYDGKKCENCRIDFPDIEQGWIAADGTMDDVETLLVEKYSQPPRAWFGHPARKSVPLTIQGQVIAEESTSSAREVGTMKS